MPDFNAGGLAATPTALTTQRMEATPFAQEAPMPPLVPPLVPPLGTALVQPEILVKPQTLVQPLAQPLSRQTNSGVPPPLQRRGPPHHGRSPPSGVLAAARRAPLLSFAWGVSVFLVMLMFLGLWLFRKELTQAWPPFARLAGAMGG